MLGDRTNYGKRAEGKRITLRLYGDLLKRLQRIADTRGVSLADAVILVLECKE